MRPDGPRFSKRKVMPYKIFRALVGSNKEYGQAKRLEQVPEKIFCSADHLVNLF
jgi:hypothetical protein